MIQLSEMSTSIHSARLLTWHAAQLQSAGVPFTCAAAQAKLAASESATSVAHQCIQVCLVVIVWAVCHGAWGMPPFYINKMTPRRISGVGRNGLRYGHAG